MKRFISLLLAVILCMSVVSAFAYIDGEKYQWYCKNCGMEWEGGSRCTYCGGTRKLTIPDISSSGTLNKAYAEKTSNGYTVGATFTIEQAGDIFYDSNYKMYLPFKAALLYNQKKVKSCAVNVYATGKVVQSGTHRGCDIFQHDLKFDLPSDCAKGEYTILVYRFVSSVHGGPYYEKAQVKVTVSSQSQARPGTEITDPSGTVVGDLKYKLNTKKKTASVIGAVSKQIRQLTVPDTISVKGKEYKVTSIASDALRDVGMTTLTIGKNVKEIGSRAFYVCKQLEKVYGGYYVNKIGKGAFSYCTALKEMQINSRVKSIGDEAFNGCTSLKTLRFDGNSLKTIGKKAFYTCTALASVSGGWYLVTIGDYAFQNCSSLSEFTVTSRVESIGNKAFCNCTSLKSVQFTGNSLRSIGREAFSGIKKNAVFYCPEEKLFFYQNLIQYAGAPQSSIFMVR